MIVKYTEIRKIQFLSLASKYYKTIKNKINYDCIKIHAPNIIYMIQAHTIIFQIKIPLFTFNYSADIFFKNFYVSKSKF